MSNNLKSLGNETNYVYNYTPEVLEAIDNKNFERDYFVNLVCNEFTCVCPITHQPDFATIIINHIPDKKLVESKSLKLYLTSFRNFGTFHEDVINTVANDLIKLLEPRYIEVTGDFSVRGGISIKPYVNFGSEKFEELARQRLESHFQNFQRSR